MRVRLRLAGVRSAIALILIVFLGVFGTMLALGTYWERIDSKPSIRLLGSGNAVSMLVIAPHARLLIANGADAGAFGNALADALRPTNRRIDILVLAGDASDLPVAGHASRELHAAMTWVISGPLAAQRETFGIPGDRVIASPIRFDLGDGLDVSISPDTEASGGWIAEISRGQTLVYAGTRSMLETVAAKPDGVIVVDTKLPDFTAAFAPSVIGIPVAAANYPKLGDVATELGRGFYALPVGNGEAVQIGMKNNALVLPKGTRRLEPSLDS